MISEKVKVSPKYQIVIPKRVRRVLGLRRGEEVVVTIESDHTIRVSPSRTTKPTAMRGLGKKVWKSLGGTDRYLEALRSEWANKT